jgi:cytochrome P450
MTQMADFTGQEYLRNPADAMERLRAFGPLVKVKFPIIGTVWMTTTQEAAGRVLKDSATFSLRKDGKVAGVPWWLPGIFRALANNMLTFDEPDHTRLRGIGGEGLIAELVRVEQDGADISRDEMVAMVFLLLFAGHETTTHLISGSVFEILKDSALRDWLAEDPDRLDLAVEEFLRFVTPVQFSKPRHVRRDVEIDGVMLAKGERVMAMLGAANLDPAANACPHKLDLARKPNRHIAFGTGIHFCLGHQLARLEGKWALRALLERWPDFKLAVDPAEVRWRERLGLRAIVALPVVPD